MLVMTDLKVNVLQNGSEHLREDEYSLHGSKEEAVCHHERGTAGLSLS